MIATTHAFLAESLVISARPIGDTYADESAGAKKCPVPFVLQYPVYSCCEAKLRSPSLDSQIKMPAYLFCSKVAKTRLVAPQHYADSLATPHSGVAQSAKHGEVMAIAQNQGVHRWRAPAFLVCAGLRGYLRGRKKRLQTLSSAAPS